jgi:hypothetical protein
LAAIVQSIWSAFRSTKQYTNVAASFSTNQSTIAAAYKFSDNPANPSTIMPTYHITVQHTIYPTDIATFHSTHVLSNTAT